MPNPVMVCENGGNRLIQVGRVGFDEEIKDLASYSYTCTLETDDVAVAGENVECTYQMITLVVRRTTGYTLTMQVWIDNRQTKIHPAGAEEALQTITFTASGQFSSEQEDTLEAVIGATEECVGKKIRVKIELVSSNLSPSAATVLLESIEVHYLPLGVEQKSTGETQ